MSVWWRRTGETYRPPAALTREDRVWLAEHLRLAGYRCGPPPTGTVAAAGVGFARMGAALRGEVPG